MTDGRAANKSSDVWQAEVESAFSYKGTGFFCDVKTLPVQ